MVFSIFAVRGMILKNFDCLQYFEPDSRDNGVLCLMFITKFDLLPDKHTSAAAKKNVMNLREKILYLIILFGIFLIAGCARNLTETAEYSLGLHSGDIFVLKTDVFISTDQPPVLFPPNPEPGHMFSSIDEYLNMAQNDSRHQYVKGIVPKGTKLYFSEIKGYSDYMIGLSVSYFGYIMTGQYKSEKLIEIDSLLFLSGREKRISDNYLIRIKRNL